MIRGSARRLPRDLASATYALSLAFTCSPQRYSSHDRLSVLGIKEGQDQIQDPLIKFQWSSAQTHTWQPRLDSRRKHQRPEELGTPSLKDYGDCASRPVADLYMKSSQSMLYEGCSLYGSAYLGAKRTIQEVMARLPNHPLLPTSAIA